MKLTVAQLIVGRDMDNVARLAGRIVMKFLVLIAVLFARDACAASPPESSVQRKFEAPIDQLCAWTGMKRAGPVRSVKRIRFNGDPPYDDVELNLAVGHRIRKFGIQFNLERRVGVFEPRSYFLNDPWQRGKVVQDARIRAACIGAIRRLNRHLHIPCYGRASVVKAYGIFLVGYQTVSQAELEKRDYLHPWVTFYMTADGVVFGLRFGA